MTPTTFLALAFVVALASVVAVLWRRTLVMGIPFLVILSGLPIHMGGVSVRLDQLATCALLVPLGASVLLGTRRLYTDAITWWLAAILAMNVVASVVNSPARSYSLAQCANLASVWVIYVLLLNFLDTRVELETFLRAVLWAAIAASLIGVTAYFLALSGARLGGAEVSGSAAEHLTNAYGAYGTMLEPNLFGSFTGAHLVLAIVLLVAATRHAAAATHPQFIRWVLVCTAVGLVLSFTRAAWLGAIAGVAWFVAFGAPIIGARVRPWRLLAPLGLALVVALALLLVPGDAGALFRFKLFNLVNLGSQTAALRVVTYSMALQQTVVHPLVGWGTFSFAPLAAQGADFQHFENWRNLWIGNYLLLALHDTGIVGLVLWFGLLWSVLARGVRTARALVVRDAAAAGRMVGLIAAIVSLLIPFLTTTGFSLGYPWLLIGLLGAHGRLAASHPAVAT